MGRLSALQPSITRPSTPTRIPQMEMVRVRDERGSKFEHFSQSQNGIVSDYFEDTHRVDNQVIGIEFRHARKG